MSEPRPPAAVPLPPGIAALGPDVPARIAALVEEARARQARELEAAMAEATRIVPRPLRGVVRKVLGT